MANIDNIEKPDCASFSNNLTTLVRPNYKYSNCVHNNVSTYNLNEYNKNKIL